MCEIYNICFLWSINVFPKLLVLLIACSCEYLVFVNYHFLFRMKVTLGLVIIVLVMGGEAINCHICEVVKDDGNKAGSIACEATSVATCREGEDVCRTITVGYSLSYMTAPGPILASSIFYECGTKPKEGADDAACGTLTASFDGFADFKCESKYCDTDACNTGQVSQTPFFVLVATIIAF